MTNPLTLDLSDKLYIIEYSHANSEQRYMHMMIDYGLVGEQLEELAQVFRCVVHNSHTQHMPAGVESPDAYVEKFLELAESAGFDDDVPPIWEQFMLVVEQTNAYFESEAL